MRHAIQQYLHDPADPGHPMNWLFRPRSAEASEADLSRSGSMTTPVAARLAAEFGADAFSYGRDIYFAAGRDLPGRAAGPAAARHMR